MEWMKQFVVVLGLMVISSATAQKGIDRIDPPHWWVDMHNQELQLMVYGEQRGELVSDHRRARASALTARWRATVRTTCFSISTSARTCSRAHFPSHGKTRRIAKLAGRIMCCMSARFSKRGMTIQTPFA